METLPIPSLPGYTASDTGAILSPAGARLLPWKNWNGYWRVRIRGRNYFVHRLVAEAFHGPCPPGKEVDHVDRDRANSAPLNLRYLTPSANQRRAGSRPSQRRLTPRQAAEIKASLAEGVSLSALSVRYGITVGMVSHIKAGRCWAEARPTSPPQPPGDSCRQDYADIWDRLYSLGVGEGFDRAYSDWETMARAKASIESVLRRHGETWFRLTSHETAGASWILRLVRVGSGESRRSSRCEAIAHGQRCRGLSQKGSTLCPAHLRAGRQPIDPLPGQALRAARKAARLTLADMAEGRPSLISRLSLVETGKQRVTPAVEALYRKRLAPS